MTRKEPSNRRPRSFAISEGEKAAASGSTPAAEEGRNNDPKKAKTARKPRAIDTGNASRKIEVEHLPEEAVDKAYAELAESGSQTPEMRELRSLEPPAGNSTAPRKGFGWGKLALSALTVILGLAASLALDSFIRDLFARNDWLGYAGMVLVGLFAIGVIGLALREIGGLMRLSTIDALRDEAAHARTENDLRKARSVTGKISGLFADRPETARGRSALHEHRDAVMDGRDVIALLERDLIAPLDATARAMVMGSAKRVSVVTAVSPRALVDVGFVLFENLRLIRRIGMHYGGKPGLMGSLRLVRHVLFHLGATGAIAVGDGLVQQLIGHGLAARLSARLGEGVVNGLLTARIGIAAMDVCRPVPFDANRRPRIADFMPELVKLSGSAATGERK